MLSEVDQVCTAYLKHQLTKLRSPAAFEPGSGVTELQGQTKLLPIVPETNAG